LSERRVLEAATHVRKTVGGKVASLIFKEFVGSVKTRALASHLSNAEPTPPV